MPLDFGAEEVAVDPFEGAPVADPFKGLPVAAFNGAAEVAVDPLEGAPVADPFKGLPVAAFDGAAEVAFGEPTLDACTELVALTGLATGFTFFTARGSSVLFSKSVPRLNKRHRSQHHFHFFGYQATSAWKGISYRILTPWTVPMIPATLPSATRTLLRRILADD